ncbi:hypothetical protein LFT45_11490 [Arthrobacter sp. FW305-BF8]|uniref:hypothetical protein n=1 Tax=Arthrobacter sp. FW305-BF8 TaxID=2879617 RepID=UPI001F28ECA9|nr:hypothetical protein [Arthrobacter sp. FW305-BF8]UKA52394.1 hypothetical protein LFT45_11490 [Arthrobacter sp. FW305-BF8]
MPQFAEVVCADTEATSTNQYGSDIEQSIPLSLDRIPHSFPEAVKPAFPLSLYIWGRDHDEYIPISAGQQDNDVVLILRHQKDKALFGS